MAFTISVTVCYLVIFYMYKQVKRKEKKLSEDTVEVTAKDPYNNGEEKKETLTYYEHDLREVKKAGTSQAFGFLMTSVLHFYFKLNPPIVLQTIMLPLNMMETPAFQVHVLEKDGSANKKLQRPWMPEEKPNPFADLAKAMSPPPPEKKTSEKEAKKGSDPEATAKAEQELKELREHGKAAFNEMRRAWCEEGGGKDKSDEESQVCARWRVEGVKAEL